MQIQAPKITTELLFKLGTFVFLLGVFYQKLDGIDNRVARLERNFDSFRFDSKTAAETRTHTSEVTGWYSSATGTLITRR